MDSGKVYKPKSKMQQLAEEFRKSKEITNEYKSTKVSRLVLGLGSRIARQ